MLISPSFIYANCCVDSDGDDYADPLSCPKGTDCNDNDPAIVRGSVGCENCKDVDGDRYLGYDPEKCSLGTDCDDSDAEKNPGKGNCNKCEDKDNDGYFAISGLCAEGNDCNDDNSDINSGAEEVCDGKDNNCDGRADEGCCEIGSMSVSPTEVQPLYTGGNIFTNVYITLIKPAPPSRCTVNLSVAADYGSGGHSHDGGRPTGTLYKYTGGKIERANTIRFSYGENSKHVYYVSSKAAGIEKINAYAVESGDTEAVSIDVKVPGLVLLYPSLYEYRLTGETTTHPDNHYGTSHTNGQVIAMAADYYKQYGITLGINDMSLSWGGLFDISGNWLMPHKRHRKGTSVDIDRTGMGAYGGMSLARWIIAKVCNDHGGTLLKEVTFHCEF